MNELEAYKKLLNFMAMWIYIADFRGEYEEMMDSQKKEWDGPHHGDCTKAPMICLRCLIDEYYKQADIEIAECFKEIENEKS
jgi:hypothetical protein